MSLIKISEYMGLLADPNLYCSNMPLRHLFFHDKTHFEWTLASKQ